MNGGREDLFDARRDALDYIETNPDDHASRLLAALLSELDRPTYQAAYERERELLIAVTKRTSALTMALADARGRVLAIGREGWDSTRSSLLADALTAIDRTLEGRPHGEQ